jgi:ribosomal protein L6P/L9E
VNIIGIDNILESVKKGYQERIKNAKTDYAANENQKIVDNFDRLVEEAVFTFELILDIKLESKGKEKQVSNI